MSPEQVELHTAASRLAAAVRRRFPDPAAGQVVWEELIPEALVKPLATISGSAGTWLSFTTRELPPVHQRLVRRVEWLADLRTALRRCRRLARRARELGPAGLEYAALLRDVLRSPWFAWCDSEDWRMRPEGEDPCVAVVPCRVGVYPPNVYLVERMAEAARTLPVAGQLGDARAARGRRGPDPSTEKAISRYTQLIDGGKAVREAERIVNAELGTRYEPDSLGSMLRARKRKQRRRAGTDPKAA
jgi:hypothetical protein